MALLDQSQRRKWEACTNANHPDGKWCERANTQAAECRKTR